MIYYTTGDLLESNAEALVNTVNCEGYMGKGIAYQFKLRYPNNNKDYVRACKTGELKVGKIHHYKENDKIIINFPTKDKWREKSRIEYIQNGLDELIKFIDNNNIKSIAIPPLGSGNGGLNWIEVKKIIESKINDLSKLVDFIIYEPSQNYTSKPIEEPKLSMSALVLMQIKMNLTKFNTLRLQKTAFYTDIFSGQNYFNFKKHKYGPYDNSISIISKNIKAYQEFYGVKDTREAYRILKNKLISDTVETKLTTMSFAIEKASNFVNGIKTDHELECLSTVTFLIYENPLIGKDKIISNFQAWSEEKKEKFAEHEIIQAIEMLERNQIIENTLVGYKIR